jgi:thiol-disulfide isomerase/thioredoxin
MDLLTGLLIGTLVGSSLAVATTTEGEASPAATTNAAATQSVRSLESSLSKTQELQLVGLDDAVVSHSKASAESSTNSASDAKAETPKVLKPVKRRVLVFKATWCSACRSLDSEWPRLRAVNWRIGTKETDHFQLVDSDQRPDLVSRYGITQLPTLLLLDGDKVIERRGSLGAIGLAELYYKGIKNQPTERSEQASTQLNQN